ncbi:hypothetical protein GPECTOR_71g565 [Gonium pectorale]|uniref:RNA-binding protein NOB1 n=1 Tax=Gonium pectorale TaxID=33097 RepID=A0A150G310_GONPE|nr:hypothetical protein GPECTOR_71g565 [Gonium pectorale]|eukprot:KXZ44204.1 hypothetical protein GPECTOR_71g565 [Gonium pectorale]
MSWAAVAKSASAPAAPAEAPAPSADERIAVVDTNAIISGLRLENLADRFCTIPEVLAEVRDRQSRAFLSSLPFSLDVREPSEESVKAVQRFARETGDIHSLSAVDLKLLALTHTLELVAHGSAHLREHPVQVRTRQRHRTRPRPLPGWGQVTNPEDWKAVDEAPEELLSNAPDGGQSRIIGGAQSLLGGDGEGEGPQAPAVPALPLPQPSLTSQPQQPPEAATTPAEAGSGPHQEEARQPGAEASQAVASTSAATAAAAGEAAAGAGPTGPQDDSESDGEGDDDGGWSTACKSRNAARRRQRKERRRQAWLETQQQQQQPGPAATAAAEAPSTSGRQPVAAPAAAAAATTAPAASSAAAQGTGGGHEDGGADGGEGDDGSAGEGEGEEVEDGSEEEGEEVEGFELVTDDEGEEGDDGASEAPTATGTEALTEAATEATDLLLPNTTSNVFAITADFAMQNVMLQMGLRLVTRDGKQITRLSRWALRCSACFFVTKEAGRVFCPRCGNMTMDKVEVTVGPGGAEFFGVRKKFILRGTRYSLPKPKGGRGARRNPILREDVLLARTGGRKGGAKAKPAGELDPFAPEFGSETWHAAAAAATGGRGGRGVPGLTFTSWKNNPNEAKPQRKSRRK